MPERGLAEQAGAIHGRLNDWIELRKPASDRPCADAPIIAAVECDIHGFLAMVRDDDGPRLIANVGSGVTTATDAIGRALVAAECSESAFGPEAAGPALRQIDGWLAARRGASTIDLQAAAAARLRRAALVRVARVLARAPRHQRALLAPLADTARSIATAPLAEGAERILEMLVRVELPDEAWLRSIATFGELNARPVERRARDVGGAAVIAVILLGVWS